MFDGPYTPPPDEAFQEFARRVCESHAAEQGDPSLAEWEMVRGLAEFLRASAAVLADNLNRSAAKVDRAG